MQEIQISMREIQISMREIQISMREIQGKSKKRSKTSLDNYLPAVAPDARQWLSQPNKY